MPVVLKPEIGKLYTPKIPIRFYLTDNETRMIICNSNVPILLIKFFDYAALYRIKAYFLYNQKMVYKSFIYNVWDYSFKKVEL